MARQSKVLPTSGPARSLTGARRSAPVGADPRSRAPSRTLANLPQPPPSRSCWRVRLPCPPACACQQRNKNNTCEGRSKGRTKTCQSCGVLRWIASHKHVPVTRSNKTRKCLRSSSPLSNGWALRPAWSPKIPQAAQHIIYACHACPRHCPLAAVRKYNVLRGLGDFWKPSSC